MAEHCEEFGRSADETASDARLDAAAFHRNHAAIGGILLERFAELSGDVLEIGSGTGQHTCYFAQLMPQLTWWPTDPNPKHRQSIDAWRAHTGRPNMQAALALDACADDWFANQPASPGGELRGVLALNVVHIAPWRVAEGLVRGAANHLAPDGSLLLYGPFKRDGHHTSESNARFDAGLRADDPEWGVRDTSDLAALADKHGLRLANPVAMPANNFILEFVRGSAD